MSIATRTPATLVRNLRQRRRGDAPPDSARQTLLLLRPDVLTTDRLPLEVIKRAAVLGADAGVVVVQILRLHGSAWGLPNPGLMPSPRERAAADARVGAALAALRRRGVDADGEVLVTRHDSKGIARIATRRQVSSIVIEDRMTSRLRSMIEGDMSRSLSRRLGPGVEIHKVSPAL